MGAKEGCLAGQTGQNYAGRRSIGEVGNKEHYPMLANPDRAMHDRRPESEYTSTWQRRSQVPATRIFPDGTIRRIEYDSGTLTRTLAHCPPYTLQHRDGFMSSPMYPPPTHEHHVEHIYESPKFDRKLGRRYDEHREGPFYHELDPDSLSTSSSQPDLVLNPEMVVRPTLLGHMGMNGRHSQIGRYPDTNCNLVLEESNACPTTDFPPPPDLPPPNLDKNMNIP